MSVTIGIAGTAKNTGKTTTTAAILSELYNQKISVGLTSIGYDGEEIDNITRLPKPRLFVKKDTVVATAKKCLQAGSAGYDILEVTDILTPLGKVCIVKITAEGMVVIAGPNKGTQLNYIKYRMINDLKCKVVLVDGALNRLAPMTETDGIIIATGASRTTNIDDLVDETKALAELFNLPAVSKDESKYLSNLDKIALIFDFNKEPVLLKYGSLFDSKIARDICKKTKEENRTVKIIFVPALISEAALKNLNKCMSESWNGKDLILKDSIKLIIGGNPESILMEINKIEAEGGNVKILKTIPLLAITVNPFYPKYYSASCTYEADYINREKLLKSMRACINVPVIDIESDGPLPLLENIISRI